MLFKVGIIKGVVKLISVIESLDNVRFSLWFSWEVMWWEFGVENWLGGVEVFLKCFFVFVVWFCVFFMFK